MRKYLSISGFVKVRWIIAVNAKMSSRVSTQGFMRPCFSYLFSTLSLAMAFSAPNPTICHNAGMFNHFSPGRQRRAQPPDFPRRWVSGKSLRKELAQQCGGWGDPNRRRFWGGLAEIGPLAVLAVAGAGSRSRPLAFGAARQARRGCLDQETISAGPLPPGGPPNSYWSTHSTKPVSIPGTGFPLWPV